MVKMFWLISVSHLLLLLLSTAKAPPAVELIATTTLQSPSLNGGQPVAVQVEAQHLKNISNSLVTAETWLRSYVLPFYPSTNVTTILVGHTLLCSGNQHQELPAFISPALKNIHYSLTRWGLQNDIKATASLSSHCLNPGSRSHIKPLLTILRRIGSPYVVSPSPSPYFLGMSKVNMVIPGRRLSSIALPPLVGTISPAPDSLPPCEPSRGPRQHHGLWCVAKPSVPAETLQEALDFACGEGGADCEAIGQDGSCYYPDTVVAHASYAFNSYWQRNKKSGGTCGFGGTAMLINSDPSYSHCRFMLA